MGFLCYAQWHSLARSANQPKTRVLDPFSSARSYQRPSTMGIGRVDTPTWVVGGEPLVPSGQCYRSKTSPQKKCGWGGVYV